VKIFDEPPRSAELPYVTLGQDVISDASTASEKSDEHALTLHVWSRQGGHREAHLITGAVLEALVDARSILTNIASRICVSSWPMCAARPTAAPITASSGYAP
jgi:hypothetical protein